MKESLYDTIEHLELENGRAYHLVSNKDANIISIVTRVGKAVVEKGEIVKRGELLVLGQSEILDDSGNIREILSLKADALVFGEVIYEITIPISEMEIVSAKIAQNKSEPDLRRTGIRKLTYYLEKLEENKVEILDVKANIVHNEKNICLKAIIYAKEQIGINIPAEEVLGNEFE